MADFLYKGVVDWFLDQMAKEAIAPGDKMPSLRALSKQLELSLNTIIHGYELLTADGWIESRPKSGYFVCHRSNIKPALVLGGEGLRYLENDDAKSAWSCLAHRGALVDQSDAFLSPPARQEEVDLPVLGKGHLAVREVVSDYLKSLGIKSHASHLWLGRSPLTMLTQSVQSITQHGDTVLVITPCDPRLTTTLQSLGRRVIALAAGERGVDLDLVISCLRDETISLIVLPGQFAFPMGQMVSNLSLRRWLAIIEETKLPAIEWDMCSHLAHRAGPVMTYKSLDQSGHIIYIGGVESKGVDRSASWCLAGRHQALLEGAFLAADMALSNAQQVALSDVLQPNSKRSLTRRSRQVWANSERIKAHLESRLGDTVSFAASKGGLSLWMRLSIPLQASDMTVLLASFRHAIIPGSLVNHDPDANHWLAINVTLDNIEPLADKLAELLAVQQHKQDQAVHSVEQASTELEPEFEPEPETMEQIEQEADFELEAEPEIAEPVEPDEESLEQEAETAETEEVEIIDEPQEGVEEDLLDSEEADLSETNLESTEVSEVEEDIIDIESLDESSDSKPDELNEKATSDLTAKSTEEVDIGEMAKQQENKEDKKQRDASSDPLYNPMLDLINHDFG
ncbi:GntR family transcriptional regulator [Marinomonas transparens]|uniref:GntR family transcriptional regulator n=1 Tax=Marinomonas transparens TaxID=2795388 RepID=A0A934JMT1_9GAMM|nr:GntR family transcriptional regulator [Marinomonas transparens]MBJ7536403.1 GntR family transcriptional regulator [Marinomonas transparens]